MDDDAAVRMAHEVLSRCLDLSGDACEQARLRTTPSWDSFAHVEIVVEIEERCGVHLSSQQIESVTDFNTLVNLLKSV